MQRHNRHQDTAEVKQEPAVTVEFTLTPQHRRREKGAEPAPKPDPANCSGNIPRITRLMALAIKFQDMVDRREVRDYADLARLGYVSRARITQIMNLLNLAPDVQELLLDGPSGAAPKERHMRTILRCVSWDDQRRALQAIRTRS